MMTKMIGSRRKKRVGAAPGTMVYTGESTARPVKLRVTVYDENKLADTVVETVPELFAQVAAGADKAGSGGRVSWIHVTGVHDAEIIQAIGARLVLHPLATEDILNTDQRPKLERYPQYMFAIMRMMRWDEARREIFSEQISLVMTDWGVVSFSEYASDIFSEVHTRLAAGRRIRFMGVDYLLYALMDAVVDGYFLLLESLGDRIDEFENELIRDPHEDLLKRLYDAKREMLLVRKAVWPLREVLNSVTRDPAGMISGETQLYFRDVYDHTVHIIDTVQALRDLLVGLLDLYVSGVSNRMNEVMKVLTTIATIFMPLTFIAGVYGMNFKHMPELEYAWAYPAVMLLMLGVGIGLGIYFKVKKWL